MPNKDPNRVNRIADVIQKYLAVLVRDECSDPRLAKVTISAVEVTNDYSHAKIFFTTLVDDNSSEIEVVLNKASGFLRQKLAKLMTLYSVPKLKFVYDPSLANGAKIDKLISLINIPSDQNNE
jgi:ribosome-binding factor A